MNVKRHWIGRRAIGIALGLGLAASVAACGSESNADGNELTKVTVVTNWVPSAQHAPLYVALEEGLFKDEGLDVTIEPGKGSLDAALKVGAGSAQFGLIDTTAGLVATTQGAEIVNVAAYIKTYPGGICYNQDKLTLETLDDFQGATLGTVENDAFTLGLKALMNREGIDPAATFTEQIVDAASQQSALLAGRVDMIPCSTQSKLAAITGGQKAGVDIGFFSLAEHGIDAVGFSLVTAQSMIDENDEVVAGFTAAFTKAIDQTVADPEGAVAAVKKHVSDVTESTELTLLVDEVIPLIATDAQRFSFTDTDIAATTANAEDSFGVTLSDPSALFTNAFVGGS